MHSNNISSRSSHNTNTNTAIRELYFLVVVVVVREETTNERSNELLRLPSNDFVNVPIATIVSGWGRRGSYPHVSTHQSSRTYNTESPVLVVFLAILTAGILRLTLFHVLLLRLRSITVLELEESQDDINNVVHGELCLHL